MVPEGDDVVWLRPPANRQQRRAQLRRKASQRAEQRRQAMSRPAQDGPAAHVASHHLDGLDVETELAQFAEEMALWAEEGLADTAAEWADL